MLRVLTIAVAVLALPAIPAGADSRPFAGVWVHVGDPLGLVIGHVEELRIAPDGQVETFVHRLEPRWRDDCAIAAPPPDCAGAVLAGRGRLEVDAAAQRLRVVEGQAGTPPFVHPLDAEGWALIATANGSDWTYRLDDARLDLRGIIEVEGEPYAVVKRFHRVPPGFAADWMTFADELLQVTLARTGCALDAALARPEARDEVFATVAAAARLRRALTEAQAAMLAPGANPRAIWEASLLPFADQTADPGRTVAAPPGFDAADWAAAVELLRWVRAEEGRLDLMLPAAEPAAAAVRACLDAFG